MKQVHHMTKVLLTAALTTSLLWSAEAPPQAAASSAELGTIESSVPPSVFNAGFEEPVTSSGIPG